MARYSLPATSWTREGLRGAWWLLRDLLGPSRGRGRRLSGFELLVGDQGEGKTLGMVAWARHWFRAFAGRCAVVSNIGMDVGQGGAVSIRRSPREWIEEVYTVGGDVPEGGLVLGLVDELSAWWDSDTTTRELDPSMLAACRMQRKRSLLIMATAQRGARVTKALRETVNHVTVPRLLLNERLLQLRQYPCGPYWLWSDSVAGMIADPEKDPRRRATRPKPLGESWHAVSDELRAAYDTYELVLPRALIVEGAKIAVPV